MTPYERNSRATTPDGRCVVVSTIRHPLVTETCIFPGNEAGEITSLMHLVWLKHGPDDDLDAAHEDLVRQVEKGELELVEREPTQAEVEEAMGDLLLLTKMADDGAHHDDDELVH